MTTRFSVVAFLALTSPALADTTPQPLPFSQDWSDIGMITASNNWNNVPGVIGYRGDNLTNMNDVDARTVLAPSNVVNVVPNITTPDTNTSGGVGELHIENPTIALQGSNTADAPHIVITLNTTGAFGIRLTANIRDVDGSADDAPQQLALQYRIGTDGDFTDIPEAYIPDATEPNAATKVTPINVLLPSAVDNQPVVQLRFITTNASGNDEWVGIDDIHIFDEPTPPTAVGMASPASAQRGDGVTFTAAVTLGTVPMSTGVQVTCDLSPIGGTAQQPLFDDGTNGDGLAGDNVWTFATTVDTLVSAGTKTIACKVEDAEGRESTFDIAFEVEGVCGDGIVEGNEGCDDANTEDGDGCSATCTVETGYECTGVPSVCTDIDECMTQTDNCDENATCTNTIGSFTCECNAGWEGNGTTCTDIDECTEGTDNCDSLAACTNTPGSFTCECPSGYDGDGTTDGTGCTDIDECADETDDCVAGATCTNTDGGFTCACPDGFSGDGHMGGTGCTDNDECATMADTCDENASCTNTNGGFTCACNDGYTGDGMTCSDIDECATGLHNCAANATCTNTPGSFTCECPPGYTGDGVTCKAPDTTDDNDDDGGCCSSSTHPGGAGLLALFVIAGLRRRQRR